MQLCQILRKETRLKPSITRRWAHSHEHIHLNLFSVKHLPVSSVTQSYLTLCDSMDSRMPGFPVHHQLPELTQTHVHRVGNAIQPSHPLLSSSPPTFNLSWPWQVAPIFELWGLFSAYIGDSDSWLTHGSFPFYILTSQREYSVSFLNTKVLKMRITATTQTHNVWIILSQVISNIYSDAKLIYKGKVIFWLVIEERPILAMRHINEK